MSDDNQNNSLWANLTNKIKYKLFKATYDPDANTYADEKAKKTKKEDEKEDEKNKIKHDTTVNTTDPNKFSISRLAKKTASQTFRYLMWGLYLFLALIMAMIITNELIMYSVPIRVIFFIFVLIVCLILPPVSVILGIFYIFKGGYSYYVNNMTNRPKEEIMPTIYTLLPISVSKTYDIPWYNPFAYPKTIKATEQLPKTMKKYMDDLQASFKDFDTVKNLPLFVENLKTIQTNLSKLNMPPVLLDKNDNSDTNIPKNNNPSPK